MPEGNTSGTSMPESNTFEASPGGGAQADVPGGVRIATLLSFPLSHPGGVSTFVAGLTDALRRQYDVDLRLVAPDHFTAGPGRLVSQVVLGGQQLVQLLRNRPGVVHNHEHPALLAAAVAYRALARHPVRVVHTVHVEPTQQRALWKRVMLGWLLTRCWAVTAVSHHTAQHLAAIATPVPRTVRTIYGAVQIATRPRSDPAVQVFREAHGLGEGPVICQIGPLNFPRKVEGVVRLVEAFALVRRRFPCATLLIVGDGRLRACVEAAILRAEVAAAAHITGYLADVTLPLAAADIYCQITFQDACPLSLLEAMGSGKPVVAARTGGIPELVTDGVDALLVDGDPAEVAAAIISLLEQPETAHQLGMRAAETAGTRFTWERAATEFAAIYGVAQPHLAGGVEEHVPRQRAA